MKKNTENGDRSVQSVGRKVSAVMVGRLLVTTAVVAAAKGIARERRHRLEDEVN